MKRGQKEMRDTLIAERDKLLRQRDALDNEIKGLERAISLISGAEPLEATKPGGRRTDLKGMVLGLLQEAGTSGLNAAIAVDMANRRGVTLNQSSVSALLSRFKADGIVVYDSERYRLIEFSDRATRPFDGLGPNVTPMGERRFG
jgi:hypothetical protein